jgi:two-component system copper resistance phosphate regulon response regulator CusR
MRVLIVEDEPALAAFLRQGLEENGCTVTVATDGPTGLSAAMNGVFDVVVLDVLLPALNGLEVCRRLRLERPLLPILMLTALGTTADTVRGFEVGADDYLTKPFAFDELLARVRALARRALGAATEVPHLRFADLTIDTLRRRVHRGDVEITLTPREYALLVEFVRQTGKTFTRAELAERVWGVDFDTGTNVIDVYVNYLRNKVDKPFPTKLIHTVFGVGYVMREPEQP